MYQTFNLIPIQSNLKNASKSRLDSISNNFLSNNNLSYDKLLFSIYWNNYFDQAAYQETVGDINLFLKNTNKIDWTNNFLSNNSLSYEKSFHPTYNDNTDSNHFDQIVCLEKLTRSGNIGLFIKELNNIDWTKHPAKNFIYVIRLALEVEAVSAAQKLSLLGAKLYPQNLELEKFAFILKNPVLASKNQIANSDLEANSKWIMNNRQKYKGQWVALKNGLLLEASKSLKTLTLKFSEHKNIYFTKVH